jgi:fructoselysine-6-P-deglycase FrlB-like protein
MDSPLAQRGAVALSMKAPFDRNVSVTMYSALTLVGGLLAAASLGESLADLAPLLRQLLFDAQSMLDIWQSQISKSDWIKSDLPTYFLARGGSMASCSEARLLWEEAAKSAATAMTTGGFRHGPQEVLVTGARIGLWIARNTLRSEDLSLAQDLREQGVPTMVIGPDVRPDAADLVLPIHRIPRQLSHWQFLVDVIPAQLLSAEFARYRGANCNEFAFCPYVIESEGGLVGARLTQPGTPS